MSVGVLAEVSGQSLPETASPRVAAVFGKWSQSSGFVFRKHTDAVPLASTIYQC